MVRREQLDDTYRMNIRDPFIVPYKFPIVEATGNGFTYPQSFYSRKNTCDGTFGKWRSVSRHHAVFRQKLRQ
jgi:hypothetical protein